MKKIINLAISILLFGSYSFQSNLNILYVSETGSGTTCLVTEPCLISTATNKFSSGNVIHILGSIPSISISKSNIIIDGGTIDGILNKTKDSATVMILGENIKLMNLHIINGWSYGIRTASGRGAGLVLDNVSVHDNVLENKVGNACSTTSTHGWGSAVRTYYTSNITIKNSKIYDNCGEGLSSIMSNNIFATNLEIYDNFSVNVYPDQNQGFTLTNSKISCIKPEYQRFGLSRALSLGAESYPDISDNLLDNVIFEGNSIYNCRGVSTITETTNNWKNISITNNIFYNVPSPAIPVISGINIITSPNTINGIAVTPTKTNTLTPTKTITVTATKTVTATVTSTSVPQEICIKSVWLKTLNVRRNPTMFNSPYAINISPNTIVPVETVIENAEGVWGQINNRMYFAMFLKSNNKTYGVVTPCN